MEFEAVLQEARVRGRRRHARWRPELFERAVEGPLLRTWGTLAGTPEQAPRFLAYMDLMVEALGRGVVDASRLVDPTGGGLLPALLLDFVPRHAASLSPTRLTELWNIGEGLRDHAEWLDRLVAAAVVRVEDPRNLETFLASTLRTLGPLEPGELQWPKRHLRAQVLSLRAHASTFVPGTLRFITPRVLAVHDRRRKEELAVAVLDGDLWVAGPLELPEKGCPPSSMPVALSNQQVRVGESRLMCAGMTTWQHVVVSQAGFVAATCVDSQRLWIGRTQDLP